MTSQQEMRTLTVDQFLRKTRPKMLQVQGVTPGVEGGTVTFRLPQNGYGTRLFVKITGTIVLAGTITGGTWKGGFEPAPYGFIKNLRLSNNQAVLLRDISGTGWYLSTRSRYGFDPARGQAATYSTNTQAAGGLNLTSTIPTGTQPTAGTYTYSICLPIDLAYNQMGENGLLILQSNSVYYDLSLVFGQAAGGMGAGGGTNDFFNAVTGSTISVTHTFNTQVFMEYFEMVPPELIPNQISTVMVVSETVNTGLFQGDNVYQLPPQDFYTKIDVQTFNAGGPVLNDQITKFTLSYNGQITDISRNQIGDIMRNFYDHNGLPPMDGVCTIDMGIRRGSLGRRDTFDAFANLAVTDAKITTTLGVATSGVNGQRFVTESLRRVAG
jgi:hypothetical protein